MSGKNHAVTFAAVGVSKSAIYQGPPTAFTIVDDPGHILHDPFSPTEPPAWLVASVEENGVQVPIRIRRDGKRLLVVAGRSRVRAALAVNAAREAKGEAARVVIRYILDDGTDEQAERAKEIENFHRRTAGAAVRAATLATHRARGWTDPDLAALLTVPVGDLERLAAVNLCAVEVRAVMDAGRLDWRLAPKFAAMSREEQVEKVAEMIGAGATMGRKARAAIKAKQPAPKKDRPTPRAVAAFRSQLNGERATVADVLAYLDGDAGPLVASAPKVAARLDEIRTAASKPGRKASTRAE